MQKQEKLLNEIFKEFSKGRDTRNVDIDEIAIFKKLNYITVWQVITEIEDFGRIKLFVCFNSDFPYKLLRLQQLGLHFLKNGEGENRGERKKREILKKSPSSSGR